MPDNLYQELKRKKQNGVQLSWDNISYDELYTLWGKESTPDSLIAKLYDVDKKEVTKKRYQWGIKQFNVVAQEFSNLVMDHMNDKSNFEKIIEEQEYSDKVKELLDLIESLSRGEKNALISSLCERDEVLSEIADAARSWYRLNEATEKISHGNKK